MAGQDGVELVLDRHLRHAAVAEPHEPVLGRGGMRGVVHRQQLPARPRGAQGTIQPLDLGTVGAPGILALRAGERVGVQHEDLDQRRRPRAAHDRVVTAPALIAERPVAEVLADVAARAVPVGVGSRRERVGVGAQAVLHVVVSERGVDHHAPQEERLVDVVEARAYVGGAPVAVDVVPEQEEVAREEAQDLVAHRRLVGVAGAAVTDEGHAHLGLLGPGTHHEKPRQRQQGHARAEAPPGRPGGDQGQAHPLIIAQAGAAR